MKEPSAATVDDLRTALAVSHRSLDKIGEGDWTPQDSAHEHLVRTVEKYLVGKETVRYDDAE